MSDDADLRVYVRHLRAANMCNREPRIWFARHGFSWSDFIANGISVEDVIATGDIGLAQPAIDEARKERDNVGRR
jgi:uncharacterized protein YaiI (UPF0178 family)